MDARATTLARVRPCSAGEARTTSASSSSTSSISSTSRLTAPCSGAHYHAERDGVRRRGAAIAAGAACRVPEQSGPRRLISPATTAGANGTGVRRCSSQNFLHIQDLDSQVVVRPPEMWRTGCGWAAVPSGRHASYLRAPGDRRRLPRAPPQALASDSGVDTEAHRATASISRKSVTWPPTTAEPSTPGAVGGIRDPRWSRR